MLVEIKNLVRYFKSTPAVNNISFGFDAGQIFGFVGPNGAGKTTTMRILATLDQPQYGDCIVDGYSVVEYPDKVRQRVGFMPDSLPALKDVSVREYVDFFARAYGLKNPERQQIVNQIMVFTNLTDIESKTLDALSKGMKQRVSLARALVHNPKVLILDEPANGLDPRARIQMRDLLKALAKSGKAILISSHILSELDEICDGVVFIEKGELLAAGTIGDIANRQKTTAEIEIRLWTPAPSSVQDKTDRDKPDRDKSKQDKTEPREPAASSENKAPDLENAAPENAAPENAAPENDAPENDAPESNAAEAREAADNCLDADAALKRLGTRLLEWPEAGRVERLNDRIVVQITTGEAGAVRLLKQLVEEGFPIIDFHLSQNQLENLFLTITHGEIQ